MHQTTRHTYQVTILVVVWTIIHVFLFLHFGLRNLFDSAGYVQGADYLLEYGKFEDTHHVFYAIPISLLAFFRWLFPQQIVPFLIFQCLLSGIATWALFRSGTRLFRNSWAGFSSGILFLIWLDNIHWNTVIMTESLFCTFACFLLYQLVYFNGRSAQYFFITFMLVAIFFTRPTGIVLILGTIVFLLSYHWNMLSANPVKKYSIIVLCVMVACSGALLMFTRWDFTDQYKRGNIVTYMDTIEGIELYRSSLRLDTTGLILPEERYSPILKMGYFIYHNPWHFFKAAILKTGYLVTGVRPYYSILHNSCLIAWMTGLYFLSFQGWRGVKGEPITISVVAIILVNCMLIAISTVDWDNRFYIPMEPGIVLLAGGGSIAVFERIRKKN